VNIIAGLLILITACLVWNAYLTFTVAVKRWRLGMFRPAVIIVCFGVILLALAGATAFGAYASIQVDRGYERAGVEDVIWIGNREGFEYPLLTYTDADTGKFCVGEKVGGEEYVREVECIDPPE
jgi:hypothetical protein